MNKNTAIPKLMTFNWMPDETSLIITLYPPFIEMLTGQFKKPGRLLEDFLARNPGFVFDSKNFNRGKGIGAGECLRYFNGLGKCGREVSFRYQIPNLYIITEEICSECEGTKTNKRNGWKCYECRETGKKVIDDDKATENFQNFGLTMYIFSKLMDYCAMSYSGYADDEHMKICSEENFRNQQTMMFQISEKSGMSVAYMGAWLHNEVIKRVIQFNEVEELAVRQAMFDVECTLLQRKSDIRDFRLLINGDTFWLQVPGSACTLGIESQFGNHWAWGSLLSPHNIDHRIAQLSFLAGLVVLNSIAVDKE